MDTEELPALARYDENDNISISACLCKRPPCVVQCKNCGIWFKGRVSLPCPKHPKVIHLMDYSYCPNPSCKSSSKVLKEY